MFTSCRENSAAVEFLPSLIRPLLTSRLIILDGNRKHGGHTLVMSLVVVIIILVFNAPAFGANARQIVSVVDYGATPNDDSDDDAPAFRNAIKSNTDIIIPPGRYYFRTVIMPRPEISGRRVGNYAVVHINDVYNFNIFGSGAILKYDPSLNEVNPNYKTAVTVFVIQNARNFSIEGLTFVSTREGLTSPKRVPVGISFFSVSNFIISNLTFEGNYSGIGTAFAGDWLFNGKIIRNKIIDAGSCADFAFLQKVEISSNYSSGSAMHSDSASPHGKGLKCWSFIHDWPNAGGNQTGLPFDGVVNGDATVDVSVINNIVKNFSQGAYITSGQGYRFQGNTWEGNGSERPGVISGGITVSYSINPKFSSQNHPPANIIIDGDYFLFNGVRSVDATPQAGVVLDASKSKSEEITGVSIMNSTFIGNRANICVISSNIRNLTVEGNLTDGGSKGRVASADHTRSSKECQ